MAAHVLAEVSAATRRHEAVLMVIGATARDILAAALTESPPDRSTADVDIAVAVPTWAAYTEVTAGLTRAGRHPHRFLAGGIPVDVVPFGGLESPAGTVEWGDGTRMSTRGLREVHAASERVVLPGGTLVRVPTVAGLTALKLSAWSDRRLETRRDAVDLRTIIGWYGSGAHLDALYEDDVDLLERYAFDPGPASAHRLGRHVADVLGAAASSLVDVLDRTGRERLAADMPTTALDPAPTIQALHDGMQEAVASEG